MNSEFRENKGYTSSRDPKTVRIDRGNQVDAAPFRKAEAERLKEYAIVKQEEKGYDRQLTELGKVCRLVEHFDKIKLSDQNIPMVGPFEDPSTTTSFQNGYKGMEAFINNGYTEESYHNFVANYEMKYNVSGTKHK